MNWELILSIVMTILTIVSTIVGYYFKIKERLIKEATSKIEEAEKEGVNGLEKMTFVVDELYALVPAPYRAIFNKELIKNLVQMLFDKIEAYAEKQVNKNK